MGTFGRPCFAKSKHRLSEKRRRPEKIRRQHARQAAAHCRPALRLEFPLRERACVTEAGQHEEHRHCKARKLIPDQLRVGRLPCRNVLIRKIYEDNVIGRLPDRLFQSMLTDYENEQNELNKIIETDTADMQRIIGGQNNVERFLKLVKKYENITELTPAMINEFIDKILVHEPQGKGADRTTEVEIYLNYVGQFQVPVEQHEPTEEERIAAEKEAERLRRKRESNRKYMKKIREKSKEFAEHERIAEEKSSDSNVCVEQNVTSKSNRQKVKGEKIA